MGNPIIMSVDGRVYFNSEIALSNLLNEGPLFLGDKEDGTISIYVLCGDTFGYACADAEELPYAEIENLYKMHYNNPKWGSIKWVCLQRKCRPLQEVEDTMKQDGVWDENMEVLTR